MPIDDTLNRIGDEQVAVARNSQMHELMILHGRNSQKVIAHYNACAREAARLENASTYRDFHGSICMVATNKKLDMCGLKKS